MSDIPEFAPGCLVECIFRQWTAPPSARTPTPGMVYTVRDLTGGVHHLKGGLIPAIRLVEITNSISASGVEPCFDVAGFRPVRKSEHYNILSELTSKPVKMPHDR
jgi:hypothetical protein